MKKNKKTLYWIICIVSILIGAILFSIGISLGGATSFSLGSNGLNFYNGFTNKDNQIFETVIIDETDITKIDLDNNFSKITITYGDKISLKYNSDLEYEVKNDNTLHIESSTSKQKSFGFFALFYGNNDMDILEITLPQYVKDLKISSEGNVTINGISLENFEIENDIGNIVIKDTIATTGIVKNDLGNITLSNCTLDTSNITSSLGNIITNNFQILVSANFQNDMGNTTLDFADEEKLYNFDIAHDLGNLIFNGKKNNYTSSNGTINITINSSMGNIDITTK